jgi:hypothetical protein
MANQQDQPQNICFKENTMKAKLKKITMNIDNRIVPNPKPLTVIPAPKSQGLFWIYREVQPREGETIYDNLCEYKLVTYATYIKIKNTMSRNRRGHWQIYSHPVK